jgi:hypothetical protein
MKKTLVAMLFLAAAIIPAIFWIKPFPFQRIIAGTFAVSDTSKINRVDIISGDTLCLQRVDNGWTVNKMQNSNPVALNNLLFVLGRIEKTGITKASLPDSIRAIKIRIVYGRKSMVYRFYASGKGAFLQHEGDLDYYPVAVPGFPDIRLEEVFNPAADYWADRILMDVKSEEISEIRVTARPDWGHGFRIARNVDSFGITPIGCPVVHDNLINTEKILMYTSYFSGIFYDSTWNKPAWYPPEKLEKPEFVVEVVTVANERYTLEIFPLFAKDGIRDDFSALVRLNNHQSLCVSPYITLDLLMQTYEDFYNEYVY